MAIKSNSKRHRQRRNRLQRQRGVEHLEPKLLMAVGPQLVAISPNEGDLLNAGDTRSIAPQELTFRFDENQVIDTTTLDGIRIFRVSDGQAIEPGYIGLGEFPNEVIVRFADKLRDDNYRIDVIGQGSGALTNISGEPFNDGVNESIPFELNLAPQITAVVPQPITRDAQGQLVQNRNQIAVYFNDDDLALASARDRAFYQLIYTRDTITNADDIVHLPTRVDYDPSRDLATLTFATDISNLSPDGTFRLRVGTAESLPGAPNSIDLLSEEVGATFTSSHPLGTLARREQIISSAITPTDYPLRYPGEPGEPGRPTFPLIEPDPIPGISTIEYNFQSIVEVDGNRFFNLITTEQKERAREVVDLLSSITGVQFIETPDSGITVGTLTIASLTLTPDVVAVPFTFQDDSFGGNWYTEALRQWIGQLTGEFTAAPDPLFLLEDPTRDFSFVTPVFIDPTIADPPVIEPTKEEQLFPRNSTVVNLQSAWRPDSNDVDVYQFQLTTSGVFTAETVAQRSGSELDSNVRLYRAQGARPALIAQNDDYFGHDSLLDLELGPGTYYITVSASGLEFDPISENGVGGLTEGEYDLRLNFRPTVRSSLVDATGVVFDGDADGRPGGVYNFWFQGVDQANTLYVDKSATGVGQRGSLTSPYHNIQDAFRASTPGDIVRIVGNGGADRNLSTLGDNLAYEIGFNQFRTLSDGQNMVVPKGVTVMIDAGAVFKLFKSSIQVGSSSVSIDLSGSAIQVLGTPNNSVVFTSYDDQTIGVDTNPLPTTPRPGDWGGILIRNDLDRAEGRDDYEQLRAYPNYINHADIRYGGSRVSVASVEQVIDPIHLISARAEVSHNLISFSADAAISANPDAFEESRYNGIDSLGIDYQQAAPFTADYSRVGPDVHDNLVVDNTINGLFVRIQTTAAQRLQRMTVTGRWDDLDIVHVVAENLIIEGESGGPLLNADGTITPRVQAGLKIDPGAVVKLDGARIEGTQNTQILAEGAEGRSIIFTSLLDDRFGAGGTFDTSKKQTSDVAGPGDWAGIYIAPAGRLSIDHAVLAYGGGLSRVEGSFAAFNTIEVHQAHARLTNSTIEFSANGRGGQADLDRVGRLDNEKSAIFVRGSEAIIVHNIIRGTEGIETPVISVDTSSLSYKLTTDPGRSTGSPDRFTEFGDNQGALVRLNRLADNSINGMEVRGGTVSTGVVLDDTDIVHVIFDAIQVPNFVTNGGVRLESSVDESLVIKLATDDAGFVGSGQSTPDAGRIGGILQVIGQPGHPVVMTSLYDDAVGAGFDTKGQPLNVTSSFNRPLPRRPANSFQIDLNYGPQIRDLPKFREAAELAARIWESLIEDPVRVTIDLEFSDLGTGTLGVTSNVPALLDFDDVRAAVISDARGRAHEAIATQVPDHDRFAENVILPDDPANPFTISDFMSVPRANAKALGFDDNQLPIFISAYDPTEARDAEILMNDDFEIWDFDRTDGILPSLYDFTGVLVHEIGHALGFVTAVDDVDAELGNPTLFRDLTVTPLDLFRLSPGEGHEDFAGAARNLDPRRVQVLYDGGLFDGVTPRNHAAIDIPNLTIGDVPLSRGTEFGDGGQASHLKDDVLIDGLLLGMMDPTVTGPGREFPLTQVDRQAFDLIGWDVIGGPIAGDWRGVTLETLANDANLGIYLESESTDSSEIGNSVPDLAEFLGALAPNQKAGDETNRLGFTVQGFLNGDSDVDVFSFDGTAGTQIWVDIDRTSTTLDAVIELIDANGMILARSDDSFREAAGEENLFATPGTRAKSLPLSPFGGVDYWQTNLDDPGMRVFLPGASGTQNTYHLRVRSSSNDLRVVAGGKSNGVYEMQIRLQEADQLAGSTVRQADIRYAVDGIRVRGLPGSSPLTSSVQENTALNDDVPMPTFAQNNPLGAVVPPNFNFDEATYIDLIRDPLRLTADPAGYFYARSTDPYETEFQDTQLVGDITSTRSGAITITGSLDDLTTDVLSLELIQTPDKDALFVFDATTGLFVVPDIDWYEIDVPSSTTVTFDMDYAAGIAGPDASIFVYEAFYRPGAFGNILTGVNLVYTSKDGRDVDDVPAPGQGADLDDLTRGSVSSADPYLGPVTLTPSTFPGKFLVAVTAGLQPIEYDQFSVAEPSIDPDIDTMEGRDILELTPTPNNPFIRFEPIDGLVRVIDDGFEGDDTPTTAVVPHHLGDVPLFISASDGSSSSSFSLVNPFTGSNGGQIGTFDRPIGDFDLRTEDYNFYAYTLGMTDEDTGNYLVINPDDATFRGVEDDAQELTDDMIETWEPDPNNPMGSVRSNGGAGEGVQFQAFAFVNDRTGLAIGNRTMNAKQNILYQFSVPRGDAVGQIRPEADRALPDNANTDITEVGLIDITLDPGKPDTILTVLQNVVVNGELTISDGDTIALQSGEVFEFNIGPELILNLDPEAGRFFVDGEMFTVNGVAYEVDTGSVLQILDPAISDGRTFTLTNDNLLNPQSFTFEFDLDGDGNVADQHIPIGVTAGGSAEDVVAAVVAAMNARTDTGITASAAGNRISFVGESRLVGGSTGEGVTGFSFSGAPGVSAGRLFPLEETYNITQVGQTFKQYFGDSVAVLQDRMVFPGATADFDALIQRFSGVALPSSADSSVSGSNNGIDILPSDTRQDVANKISTAIGQAGGNASTNGFQVVLTGSTFAASSIPANMDLGGENPGGVITGMQFVNGRLFVVTDKGGLYSIQGPNADYIETSAPLNGKRFSGLTIGPQKIEKGLYSRMMFATTTTGEVFAFDTTGLPQSVFAGGASSVKTGVSSANGLLFSPADETLWNSTTRKGPDIGHGDLDAFGFRVDAGVSMHFGDTNPDLTENRNYNFPGGTHGTLVTDPFSLEGFVAEDQPVLYFNYYLVTDASDPNAFTDSFRVYITDETAAVGEGRGEWVALADNKFTADIPLFDNSWEDQPELFPADPQEPNDAATRLLRRNGARDPYTNNRSNLDDDGMELDNPPYPMPSEEASIWRQARIDLSDFAGSDSLRIRFDFSSAGTLGVGDPLNGGTELRAVAGALIADGDQFVIDDVVFEFDLGLTLDASEGRSISDGETVLLTSPTSESLGIRFQREPASSTNLFVTDEPITGLRLDLTLDGETTALRLERSLTTDPVTTAQNIADLINAEDLPYTATAIGSEIVMSLPGIEVESSNGAVVLIQSLTISDEMTASDVANLIGATVNDHGTGVADVISQRIHISGFADIDLSAGTALQVSGQEGLNGAVPEGTRRVPISAAMTADQVAAAVKAEVVKAFNNGLSQTVKSFQNMVLIHGHRVTDPGPLGMAASLPGDGTNRLYDPIRGRENQLQYFEIEDDNNQGGGQDGEVFVESGNNNFVIPYEGIYLDDLIVGFASRGEKVRDHRLPSVDGFSLATLLPVEDPVDRLPLLQPQTQRGRGTEFDMIRNDINGRPPLLPDDNGVFPDPPNEDGIYDGNEVVRLVDRSHFLPEPPQFVLDPDFFGAATGSYQLEIRVTAGATASRIALSDLFPELALDPRERFSESLNLRAFPGSELLDGQTVTLTDGNNLVTLEYEDLAIGDGVATGHVSVPFRSTDSAEVLAEHIRDVINSPAVANPLRIRASSSSGDVLGPANDNQVFLYGKVFVQPGAVIDFEEVLVNDSRNDVPLQGQIIIDSNRVVNSQMFGIVTEDGYRAVPDPLLFDPELLWVHAPQQVGEFQSFLGAAKDTVTLNAKDQIPSVVISNNVIALGGAGGIHATGDPGGFTIIPPLGGDEYETEVWDNYPFIFAITDQDGLTVNFEFDADGVLNNVVPAEPVTITVTNNCPYNDRACMPRTDVPDNANMAAALARAIQGSALNVNVWMNPASPSVPLFIEGAADVFGVAAGVDLNTILLVDWFTPWYDQIPGVRTFSRIVNNTIAGIGGARTDNTVQVINVVDPLPGQDRTKRVLINDYRDAGILLEDGAFPTILNNITVNLEAGIKADNSSNDAVVGATVFQQNIESTDNINIGDFPIELRPRDPLFVNVGTGNYYLAAGSLAIDSSIDSLEDRPELVALKEPIGIARSNILAPDRDELGQLREDDPSAETPSGLGQNVFKDRGAIDRVDFEGPAVQLSTPRDNDSEGLDKNPAETVVTREGGVLTNFTLQFVDSFRVGDPRQGTGIDPASISPDSVVLTQSGRLLQVDVDYTFSYDRTNSVIRLTPIAGVWPGGHVYEIDLSGNIRDIAGNLIRPNRQSGATQFTIESVIGADYGDAPAPYPTLLANNGPRHSIVGGFFLGNGVTADSDGTPNVNAAGDDDDDGVILPDLLTRDAVNRVTVRASAGGFLDAWLDLNQDGDWNDAGEQIADTLRLSTGANTVSFFVPEDAKTGDTFARFRFSSSGNLTPTGSADDGEVEDYLVIVDPGNVWQNPTNSVDVNADGSVSAIDVLRIIQEINFRRASNGLKPTMGLPAQLFVPPVEPNTPEKIGFVDVNGDGFATPIDALTVIQYINQRIAAAEPLAAEVAVALAAPITVDPIGELIANPVAALPQPSVAVERSIQPPVTAHRTDDLMDTLAVGTERESSTTDVVLSDLDWLDDLDVLGG